MIRHTSLAIAPGICYGQSDVEVSANFVDELHTLKQKLAQVPFAAVYCSPLQRCAKLAEALAIGETRIDTRLQELSFGAWELLPWDSIPRDIFDVWANDYAHLSPPGGESFSQLHTRATHFLAELQSQYSGQNIAIVTHGGVIRALLAEVLNMPLKGLFRFQIDYASVTYLNFEGAVPKVGYVNR